MLIEINNTQYKDQKNGLMKSIKEYFSYKNFADVVSNQIVIKSVDSDAKSEVYSFLFLIDNLPKILKNKPENSYKLFVKVEQDLSMKEISKTQLAVLFKFQIFSYLIDSFFSRIKEKNENPNIQYDLHSLDLIMEKAIKMEDIIQLESTLTKIDKFSIIMYSKYFELREKIELITNEIESDYFSQAYLSMKDSTTDEIYYHFVILEDLLDNLSCENDEMYFAHELAKDILYIKKNKKNNI